MYAVHDLYRPPLTKDSRVPRQQVQRCEMHIPRAGGRAIQDTQGICAPTDDILSIAGTCIWYSGAVSTVQKADAVKGRR